MPSQFEQIYADFRAPIFSLCLHITGNPTDAEDALQDSFLAVLNGLKGFRQESSLFTWVYRIAIRVALRTKAGSARHTELDFDVVDGDAQDNPAMERQKMERLSHGLLKLKPAQRVVLGLFAIKGLSHEEIAAILNVPLGTVWSRLHTAKKELSAAMNDPSGN
jgi:RNA polymerase sigma-70 factor (ECF subfamily)